MKLYPAIDLLNGKCVRLYKGLYDQSTVYDNNPLSMALKFAEQGAKNLHVVDLDGAKSGQAVNLDIIINIKKNTDLIIQTGGGIRTRDQANTILNSGIDKIIVGSLAVSNPSEIKSWIKGFGAERIVLALDTRNEKLAVHGWEAESEKSLWELLDDYQDSGLMHVICTDINLDGTLEGPNMNLYKIAVKKYPDILFQASGGISNLRDLKKLSEIPVSGTIIGKALYENKFTLREALDAC